jgi:nucleotide-binding universal stress UspA family protein
MSVDDVSSSDRALTGRRGIHRVLVAFDGSPRAWAALDEAIAVAVAEHALLTIAGVVGEPPRAVALSPMTLPYTRESILRDLEREMARQLAAARDAVPQAVSVTTQLLHGRPKRAVAALAEAGRYDLVIAPRRPAGWLRRLTPRLPRRRLARPGALPPARA